MMIRNSGLLFRATLYMSVSVADLHITQSHGASLSC